MNINWDKAPEGFDYALTTASDWDGAPEYEGTVRFAKKRENSDCFECSEGLYPHAGLGSWVVVATRPEKWNGKGVPQVGTVCEVMADHIREGDWTEVKVLALGLHEKDVAVLVAEHVDGIVYEMHCLLYSDFEDHFRPIKTKEQIAAEEREKTCEEMLEIVKSRRPGPDIYDAIGALYDAGYRRTINEQT